MRPLPLLSAVSLLGCLAGCGGGAPLPLLDAPFVPPVFAPDVTHPHFPAASARTLVYEGEHAGARLREEVRTLPGRRVISGVTCTGVEEHTWLDGALASVTTEWFAQDLEGNVWKFGEESREATGAGFTVSADSWIAGVGGGVAWRVLPASPRVGDRFVGYSRTGPVVLEIVSVTSTADVPAGTFAGCLELVENPDDPEDRDVILYAPTVGRVLETNTDGQAALTSY